jgi:thiol-disulfide isomerase/thioredoxin
MFKRGITAGMIVLIAGAAMAQGRQPEKTKDATTTAAPKEMKKEPRKITVGDRPPEITVKKFVKGEPVTGFEKGKVYVVEFWATWCGPCKMSIPHLTEMQHKFDGKATIVGVSVWEDDQADVEPFVKNMGEKMAYTIAMDDVLPRPEDAKLKARSWANANGKMSQAWLAAADQNGIPSAFIINQDSKIAWIGNPLEPTHDNALSIEDALQQVVDGKYDLAGATKNAQTARSSKEKADAQMKNYQSALKAKDADAIIKATEEFTGLEPARLGRVIQNTYLFLATELNDNVKANAFANSLLTGAHKDNAEAINAVAWTILDDEAITKRDVDTAMKLAQRAVDLTKEKDGMIIDTLALAHFQKGDAKKALELQQKALKNMPEGAPEQMVTEMKDRLKKYEDATKK